MSKSPTLLLYISMIDYSPLGWGFVTKHLCPNIQPICLAFVFFKFSFSSWHFFIKHLFANSQLICPPFLIFKCSMFKSLYQNFQDMHHVLKCREATLDSHAPIHTPSLTNVQPLATLFLQLIKLLIFLILHTSYHKCKYPCMKVWVTCSKKPNKLLSHYLLLKDNPLHVLWFSMHHRGNFW